MVKVIKIDETTYESLQKMAGLIGLKGRGAVVNYIRILAKSYKNAEVEKNAKTS